MILAFETEELRTICEDGDAARSRLGDKVADALRVRVADLRAIDSIDDLLVGSPRLMGVRAEALEVELVRGVWLRFVPNHVRPRLTSADVVDWAKVRRIRLTSIGEHQ